MYYLSCSYETATRKSAPPCAIRRSYLTEQGQYRPAPQKYWCWAIGTRMKVLIISSSPRRGGNTHRIAEEFGKGAAAAGHEVEIISLAGKNIGFCIGCLACQKTRQCVLNDDAKEIVRKMGQSNVLVFASPIYYYTISGQLKTLLDRAEPLFSGEYSFREVYLLTAGADADPETNANAFADIEGWISCFEPARLAGTVFAGGVAQKGDVEQHPALKKAYEMGKSIG